MLHVQEEKNSYCTSYMLMMILHDKGSAIFRYCFRYYAYSYIVCKPSTK